ncbi:hypothetical protein CPA56_07930 [Bombella sp. TMW2.1889]|uniref:Uncharacterized protein n=1 Tax=Bombella mellum TaxID=2039288 RepID=A0ABR5ZUA3_9PROT|nr:hypothetical protein [Bombella mellum]
MTFSEREMSLAGVYSMSLDITLNFHFLVKATDVEFVKNLLVIKSGTIPSWSGFVVCMGLLKIYSELDADDHR